MVSHYGLIANLAAVPLMGLFVMPAGGVALLFMPLGLEPLALVVMGWGLDWILLVARTVEAWPGAVRGRDGSRGWCRCWPPPGSGRRRSGHRS